MCRRLVSARARGGETEGHHTLSLLESGLEWDYVTELRERWDVPVIVKGLVTAEDADLACQYGAAGVVVSNHGGRQLDGAIASLEALPEVVDAVSGRAEVYLDGGVRRGTDVVMALALGARAVLVGRPALYGLAFGGSKGVEQVLEILREEIENALALLGCRSPDEVTASHVSTKHTLVGVAELTRNAVHVLPAGGLEAKLALGRPLRVKLGIDVTSPDIHVGRGIPLQRMRAFQDEGHVGVLIVGDYTTRIGDPSGRSSERPILSDDEIDRNADTLRRAGAPDPDPRPDRGSAQQRVARRTELCRRDSADADDDGGADARARRLRRRYSAGQPISVSELLYPLMQAYDSVAVEADVELGGTDQLYNLLAGREVMQAYGLEPQVVLTTPLLVSWDGDKMSSSVGNNIPLTAPPEEQFGRTMRIADELLEEWYRLVVQEPLPGGEPLEAKLALARWIVTRSHGEDAARAAEEHFTRVVREGRAPDAFASIRSRTAIRCTSRPFSRRRSGCPRARHAG